MTTLLKFAKSLGKFDHLIKNVTLGSRAFSTEVQTQNEEPDALYKTVELEMRGLDPAVLKSYSKFLTESATHLGIELGKQWTPRKANHERLTLLRSIHVNKKCRVQYEVRTYFTFLQLHKMTGSTCDTYLEYVQRNLPEGVAMKVSKVAIEPKPAHLTPMEK
ncbi:28S ribosomal protein S10, mitochondrial [Cimex lectularius]|uniref:Small ribosomal subunit protein uS10m n=1 Tax=Cimex lectularius TaxID=79782 RepID=A0A8I6RTH5_CIMLE|nr:28S ribosomal protein S10, mitochondrial [Cimex lectularius]